MTRTELKIDMRQTIVLILLFPLLFFHCKSEQEIQPNLVFILADDLNKEDLPIYGGTNISTPHINQLASEGMKFDHIFTASAMCAPTRMQLYTGLHPVRSGGYPNHSRVKPGVKSIVQHLAPYGYRCGLSGKWHVKPLETFAFDKVEPGLAKDAYLSYMTQDDRPFVLFVASKEPHVKWNKGDATKFDPATIKVPGYLIDNPETRLALTKYYAEIEYLDHQVKEVMEALDESGKAENTIVMFATEQGAQWPGCKWTLYDRGVAAGLVVKYPPLVTPGSVSRAMVNYIDVLPTFMDIIGAEIPGMDGKSFLNVLQQETDEHDDYVYGIHTQKGAIGSPEEGYPIRSVRSKDYLYIKNLRPEVHYSNAVTDRDGENYWQAWLRDSALSEHNAFLAKRYIKRPATELYDIKADPLQLDNLAGKEGLNEVVNELELQLTQWMEQQGDEGVKTEDNAPNRVGKIEITH